MRTDLVEYFVIAVPDEPGIGPVCEALERLITEGTIRVLDLVLVEQMADGRVAVRETDSFTALSSLERLTGATRPMLSQHDVELASICLPRDTIGVVIVTEDIWAEPLALAAQTAGGRIVGGDRVSARRLAAVRFEDPTASGKA